MTIQAKTRSLFERVNGKYIIPNAMLVASHRRFDRGKALANFCNVIVSGEAVSAE
jgi:hypothetical protein